jgi:hypothetical protein
MWMPPKETTALAGAAVQAIDMQAGKIEGLEDTPPCLTVQAFRLRQRYGLTWPVARLVASLHYGRAAA